MTVLARYQDKWGRDKSAWLVFIAACGLLLLYLRDGQRARDFVLSHPAKLHWFINIKAETERRTKKQVSFISTFLSNFAIAL